MTSVRSPKRSRARRNPSQPRPGGRLSARQLADLSAPLRRLLRQPDADPAALAAVPAVAVTPGQVLARGPRPGAVPRRERDRQSGALPLTDRDQHLECGPGVEASPDGALRACAYGYLCLRRRQLSVHPPLRLSPDAMHLHWVIPLCQAHPVTCEMIQACARDLEIVGALDQARIEALCALLQAGAAEPGLVEIAAGLAAVPEEGDGFELLVEVERQAGRLREDGSIDFHHVNFTPTVSAGQAVARRRPPREPAAGCDLLGRSVAPADDGGLPALQAGDNIACRPQGDTEAWYATTDGHLRLAEERVLSVARVLTIAGNVSFDTGDLSFDGDIFVDGSVTGGFTVDAGGDVTVAGTIEPGATVTSRGHVAVGAGVLGSRTQVAAGGDVRAQFVQDARVVAGGDITLGSFAYHARLHAAGTVAVVNGSGQRRGTVLGGEVWAAKAICMRHAGTVSGSQTLLVAGLTPDQAGRLDRITRAMETSYEQVLRILRQFGLTRMDVTQIRNLVRASTGPRRKVLANRARQLGQLAQVYQAQLDRRQQLQQAVVQAARSARIEISGTALKGVEIRLGEHRRVLDADVTSPSFHLDDDNQLVERCP